MTLAPDPRVNAFIQRIIQLEKGYVDNPDDSGGPTKWGITEGVARDCGYNGRMRDLTQSQARGIYVEQYWNQPKLDLLHSINPNIAWEVFDTGVNCGMARAIEFLQTVLNAFNLKGTLYPDLKPDGLLGERTEQALQGYLDNRKSLAESVLLKALNCLQGSYYLALAEAREKDETFVFGWINKRVELPN